MYYNNIYKNTGLLQFIKTFQTVQSKVRKDDDYC